MRARYHRGVVLGRFAFVLVLAAATPALAEAPWGELADPERRAVPGPEPKPFQRREALDAMQAALGQWQKERREHARDVERRERWLADKEAAAARTAVDAAEGDVPAHFGKVIEVDKKGRPRGAGGRLGKVIELAPGQDEQPKTALDDELGKAAERAEAAERRRREDPEGYAREKAQRRAISEGNRAWEEAVARRFKQREAEIEAEARKMQAELDAARLREERLQAKKLGGTVDTQGNFVDDDLTAGEKK